MAARVVIDGTPVDVIVTAEDMAAARTSLLRFGTPGDGIFDLAAGSYARAAEDRLRYTVPPGFPQRAYAQARRDRALVAAFKQLTSDLPLSAGVTSASAGRRGANADGSTR